MKRLAFLTFITFFTIFLLSCSQQLAGNGSEITNGYCIAEAAPAESAMVVAYPKNYVPYPPVAGPETTYTDSKGHFSMRLAQSGWNLLIYDRLQLHGAFVTLPSGDSAIDTVVLNDLGSIAGIVNDTIGGLRYIGIIGSPFYTDIVGMSDTFSLNRLPSFGYSINAWNLKSLGSYFTNPGPSDSNPQPEATFPLISVTVWPDSTTTVIISR